MNNLKVPISMANLSPLTETSPGSNTYNLVAKLFKASDGTPLGSSHVNNVHNLSVTTLLPNFDLNIPIENGTYTINGVDLRVFANDAADCCFARINIDIVNTVTSASPQAVIMSGGNKVYRYEPSTNNTIQIMDAVPAPDIAHTATKLFLIDFDAYFVVGGGGVLRIKEYDIALNPFTHSFSKNYDLSDSYYGPGLHAVSNTELYVGGYSKITKLTISGNVATPTDIFSFASGYGCTGDLIYDPVTNLYLILYDNGNGGDFRVGVFQANGTIVKSAALPVQNMYGIYQYGGVTYLIDGNGQVYTLNLSTMAVTAGASLGVNITGASQLQSNISIPA